MSSMMDLNPNSSACYHNKRIYSSKKSTKESAVTTKTAKHHLNAFNEAFVGP